MIAGLRLQGFRPYKDDSFEFTPGVNIIVGPNASGKTSLLESVLVAATGKSYKAKDQEMINSGKDWLRVEVYTDRCNRVVKISQNDKTFEINGRELKRLSAKETLPVVLFEPNHLLVLTGSPDLRRTYIDDLVEKLKPEFAQTRRHYKRSLAQRNALLKHSSPAALKNQAFIWNLRLSELGGKIARERVDAINEINKYLPKIYKKISRSEAITNAVYESRHQTENYETKLLKSLEDSLERDRLIGHTTSGPHRDDIKLMIDGASIEITASRGEIRSVIMSLKAIELQLLEEASGQKPIVLLDDVFSELDGARRQALTKLLAPYQTFITTTDADLVVHHFNNIANITPLGKSGAT